MLVTISPIFSIKEMACKHVRGMVLTVRSVSYDNGIKSEVRVSQ